MCSPVQGSPGNSPACSHAHAPPLHSPDAAIDTHPHQAWNPAGAPESFYEDACKWADVIAEFDAASLPVLIGEWSLATDNCAMWLNGFNDNLPGFPTVPCDWRDCAEPYMGPEQPGTPPDPTRGPQGPVGMAGPNVSTPDHGRCPTDHAWPDDDEVMSQLARKKLFAYGGKGSAGWFFWNFRTEVTDRWSFLAAAEKGWLPEHLDEHTDSSLRFVCTVRGPTRALPPCTPFRRPLTSINARVLPKDETRLQLACRPLENASGTRLASAIDFACGTTARIPECDYDVEGRAAAAEAIFDGAWLAGAPCDFGQVAGLSPRKEEAEGDGGTTVAGRRTRGADGAEAADNGIIALVAGAAVAFAGFAAVGAIVMTIMANGLTWRQAHSAEASAANHELLHDDAHPDYRRQLLLAKDGA